MHTFSSLLPHVFASYSICFLLNLSLLDGYFNLELSPLHKNVGKTLEQRSISVFWKLLD